MKVKASILISCIVATGLSAGHPEDATDSLDTGAFAPPSKSISLRPTGKAYYKLPIVSNGYLLSFRHQAMVSEPTNIYLTETDTWKQKHWVFDLHRPVYMRDGSVTKTGQVIIVGTYLSPNGTPNNFIANLDGIGESSRLYNLGEFIPERVCSAANGTIWTFGEQVEDRKSDSQQNYNMLREYLPDGSLKGSWLPNQNLRTPLRQPSPTMPVLLSCGIDSVGVYIGSPRSGVWTEVSLSGDAVRSYIVTNGSGSRITGIGSFGDGIVYASSADNGGATIFSRLVIKDETSAKWIASRTESVRHAKIVGRDGSSIVYSLMSNLLDRRVLYWSKISAPLATR